MPDLTSYSAHQLPTPPSPKTATLVRASASRVAVPSISSVRLNMAGCFIRGKVYQNSVRADNTKGT